MLLSTMGLRLLPAHWQNADYKELIGILNGGPYKSPYTEMRSIRATSASGSLQAP